MSLASSKHASLGTFEWAKQGKQRTSLIEFIAKNGDVAAISDTCWIPACHVGRIYSQHFVETWNRHVRSSFEQWEIKIHGLNSPTSIWGVLSRELSALTNWKWGWPGTQKTRQKMTKTNHRKSIFEKSLLRSWAGYSRSQWFLLIGRLFSCDSGNSKLAKACNPVWKPLTSESTRNSIIFKLTFATVKRWKNLYWFMLLYPFGMLQSEILNFKNGSIRSIQLVLEKLSKIFSRLLIELKTQNHAGFSNWSFFIG